jgi:hypothetical protein
MKKTVRKCCLAEVVLTLNVFTLNVLTLNVLTLNVLTLNEAGYKCTWWLNLQRFVLRYFSNR